MRASILCQRLFSVSAAHPKSEKFADQGTLEPHNAVSGKPPFHDIAKREGCEAIDLHG
jgi:hypothetical protein